MTHPYNTRKGGELRTPFSRLAVGQNSPHYQGTILYNKSIRILGNKHYKKFKCMLFQFLASNAFYSVEEFLAYLS